MATPVTRNGAVPATEASEPKPLIPPHIGWPLLVVALLATGIGNAFWLVNRAKSDGGAAVLDNYYAQAVDWDAQQAAKAASAALGWHATLHVLGSEQTSDGLVPVLVTLTDAVGQPLGGLSGTLQATRPQLAEPVATPDLAATATPGIYRALVPIHQAGLWDFTVAVQRGADRFVQPIRVDVRG